MKRTMTIGMVSLGVVSLMMMACGGAEPQSASEEINVNPATLEEAAASLASIQRLIRVRADDPRAHAALEQLRPRLDELNHLVARVEARPGQFVSFYESEPGVIGVAESGPKGAQPVLTSSDMQQSLVPLYERLSGGVKAPPSLVQAEARTRMDHPSPDLAPGLVSISDKIATKAGEEDIGSVSQALTADDGQFFRDNGCFKTGDANFCFPNWSGNSFAEANTRTSFLTIAPFDAPGPISVGLKYNGTQRYVDAVFQGEWNNYQWFSGLSGCGIFACVRNLVFATHHWDIFNADGKGFHWSFAAKWNCNVAQCETWPS